MRRKSFTLIDILIALFIIGTVAGIVLPTIIGIVNQNEYRTGLKKTISILNSTIKIASAEDGDSPYYNSSLETFFSDYMKVVKKYASDERMVTKQFPGNYSNEKTFVPYKYANAHFYTTDGIILEFPKEIPKALTLYDSNKTEVCTSNCKGCGSMGIDESDRTRKRPCLLIVDVNADRDINAPFISTRTYSSPTGKRLSDVFAILITEKSAIPYGYAAQKAFYEN